MKVRNRAWRGSVCLAAVTVLLSHAEAADIERTGGPYVPTPQVVVDRMLNFANVGLDDFVMDLGSGDGVIVLTATRIDGQTTAR